MSALALVTTSKPAQRKTYVRLTPELRAKAESEVRTLLDAGRPGRVDYQLVAQRLSISLRQVQRIAEAMTDQRGATKSNKGRKRTHALPEDALAVVSAATGNMRLAWKVLSDAGRYTGEYEQFRRALYQEYGYGVVLGVKARARSIRHGTYVQLPKRHFMQVWSIDLFSMRAPLTHDGEVLERPTGLLITERSTGVIVFDHVFPSDEVTAADVRACLAEAIRGRTVAYRDTAVYLGGLPDFASSDNGGQFVSMENDRMFLDFGIAPLTSNSYMSHENGPHERQHRTARTQLLHQFPGTQDGPRDRRGELRPDPRPLLTLEQARHALSAWAWSINIVDRGDGSAIDHWMAAVAESEGVLPRMASDETCARYAYEWPTTCQRYAKGVLVDRKHFTTAKLGSKPGGRYRVRTWIKDKRTVALYETNGRYIGIASLNDGQSLTAAEAAANQAAAAADRAAVRSAVAAGREINLVVQPHGEPDDGDAVDAVDAGDDVDEPAEDMRLDALLDGFAPADPDDDEVQR